MTETTGTERLRVAPPTSGGKDIVFFFFSLEELRMHVHVLSPDGEAKFWLEPKISPSRNYGLDTSELAQLKQIVEEHRDEITKAWKSRFLQS